MFHSQGQAFSCAISWSKHMFIKSHFTSRDADSKLRAPGPVSLLLETGSVTGSVGTGTLILSPAAASQQPPWRVSDCAETLQSSECDCVDPPTHTRTHRALLLSHSSQQCYTPSAIKLFGQEPPCPFDFHTIPQIRSV